MTVTDAFFFFGGVCIGLLAGAVLGILTGIWWLR